MKEVIYNFFKCFSKVGLFFKRLAVKIRSFRRFTRVVLRHKRVTAVLNDVELHNVIMHMLMDLKD